jgi:hypothetical protein
MKRTARLRKNASTVMSLKRLDRYLAKVKTLSPLDQFNYAAEWLASKLYGHKAGHYWRDNLRHLYKHK